VQGLPTDITETELRDYFVRCGVLRLDPVTGKE
jgi:HIV Tat-specific factor 1